MRKDRIISETQFTICLDKNDAFADYQLNVIAIGENTFTLETFIHEINEMVIMNILDNFKIPNIRITKKQKNIYSKAISHLLSPYGYKSLIYPYNKNRKEEQLDE